MRKVLGSNWMLALLFLGWSLGNLDRYVMNYAVLSITEDLSLSATSTGIVLSSFFAGYAIMQMPGGWLADRFGSRRILIISVVLWSIFTAMTGAAWSLGSILVIRFLFGIGEGGFQPAASKLIAGVFPQEKRARAMSILLTSGGLMAFITPIFSAYVLDSIGWRHMFMYIGIAGILIAVLYWMFIHNPQQAVNAPEATEGKARSYGLQQLFRTPMMWCLLAAYFSIYAVNWGLASWMPAYLTDVRGLSMKSMGLLQMIPSVASFAGLFGGGYLLDKMTGGKEKWAGALSCAVIGLMLYLMFTASSLTGVIIYQSVTSIFMAFVLILLPAIVLKKIPQASTGSAMGMVNTGGQLAGFITPTAIGFMVDAFKGSYDAAFWMLIGFTLVCAAALLSLNYKQGAVMDEPLVPAKVS
ncbi:MFS transporter [Paenibacillus typhae]|uniref:MFS transporter n=1 Tax=Paenibacillus typhae TaxID=1174501 RepID=UPI001C8DBB81|nr:MFS transporter [Paenibacillus typhae]MBY0014482.1 MFS transporter [Paenibacillus typhae]